MNGEPQSPRLIFINRYYWPEEPATAQLLTDLAEGLAAAGRRVTVVTSRGRGANRPPIREIRQGVEIVRVTATRSGRSVAGRAFDYLTFTLAAGRALRTHLRPDDRLVAMTDPPLLATMAATRGRRAGAHVFQWLQDVHPEIGIALSGSRLLAALTKPWVRRRNAAWRKAAACVAVSGDLAGFIADCGVPADRIRVIPNWAPGGRDLAPVPAAINPLIDAWGLRSHFVVAYSGNLGRVHALEPVLGAAARLRDDRRIVFLFIGDGPQRPSLEAAARAQGLDNVRFIPPQSRARLAECLSVADLHLVTLRAGCERLVFPSKLYGIAAVGRPVVYVGPVDCELAETVRGGAFGVAIPPADVVALTAAIRALAADAARREQMGQAALRWSQSTGGLQAAIASWNNLLA